MSKNTDPQTRVTPKLQDLRQDPRTQLETVNNSIRRAPSLVERTDSRAPEEHGHLFPLDDGHVGDHDRRPHRRHQALSIWSPTLLFLKLLHVSRSPLLPGSF